MNYSNLGVYELGSYGYWYASIQKGNWKAWFTATSTCLGPRCFCFTYESISEVQNTDTLEFSLKRRNDPPDTTWIVTVTSRVRLRISLIFNTRQFLPFWNFPPNDFLKIVVSSLFRKVLKVGLVILWQWKPTLKLHRLIQAYWQRKAWFFSQVTWAILYGTLKISQPEWPWTTVFLSLYRRQEWVLSAQQSHHAMMTRLTATISWVKIKL